MRIFIIISVFIIGLCAKVITFSPLPMDKAPQVYAQYHEMLQYLEKETGHKFKFIYSSSYKELIKNFKEGKIDFIELGALPYVRLKEHFNQAYPFLTFNSKYGKPYYTCNLITTEKNIDTFTDITHVNEVVLTRALSTCGYLMSEHIMKNNKESLENFHYYYVGTHSNVLLEILLRDNTVGTLKSTVLDKYSQFKFKTIEKSPNIPGFAFIANKNTMRMKEINSIKKAILKLDPFKSAHDKDTVSKWSVNTKYGAIETDPKVYDIVLDSLKKIQIPQEKR